jgi:DNA-binding NtrC family response regulator
MIKLLMIEDDIIFQKIIYSKLDENFIIKYCDKVTDAIEKIKNEDYDIILLDLILIDSNDPLETFNSIKNVTNKPIIVISSIEDEKTYQEIKLNNEIDFLNKKDFNQVDLVKLAINLIKYKKNKLIKNNLGVELKKIFDNLIEIDKKLQLLT